MVHGINGTGNVNNDIKLELNKVNQPATSNVNRTLGEGYALHKQDIFVKKSFEGMNGEEREFLSSSYFRYFNGRPYTDSECYLTITQESKKSSLFSYDSKKWRDFLVKIQIGRAHV